LPAPAADPLAAGRSKTVERPTPAARTRAPWFLHFDKDVFPADFDPDWIGKCSSLSPEKRCLSLARSGTNDLFSVREKAGISDPGMITLIATRRRRDVAYNQVCHRPFG
jgi:hypothetical protein